MWYLIGSFITFYFIFKFLTQGKSFFESISDTILFFLGICGFASFVMREYLNISYNDFPKYLGAFGFILLVFIYLKSKSPPNVKEGKQTLGGIFIKIMLFGFLLIPVIRGFFIPVNGWDAYALYDSRGKLYSQGLKQSSFAEFSRYDQTNPLYYYSYPPMTSSIHATLYASGLKTPMFIYGMFYMAFALYFYLLIFNLKIPLALKIGIFLIGIGNPLILQQITSAYTNLPMMAFQVGALYHLIKYKAGGAYLNILMSSAFLGFSIWTRVLEPTYLAIFVIVALLVWGEKISTLLKIAKISMYFLITLLSKFLWSGYISQTVGEIGETAPSISVLVSKIVDSLYLARMIEIIFFIYSSLFQIKFYILLFTTLLIYNFVTKKHYDLHNLMKSEMIELIIIQIFFVMSVGTLYLSATFPWWNEIGGSFLRSNLVIIPLISLTVALWIDEIKIRKFKKS